MSQREDEDKRRLSLLLDGEAGTQDAQALCGAWRDDAELRATWHVYHLIGDVMRSEDLAHPVSRDAAFLASLRERLSAEPVVVAPRPATTPVPRRRSWIGPVATAAGFAAVAGVLVVMRVGPEDERSGVLARSPSGVLPVAASAALLDGIDVQPLVADGKLIRDARLDRYLAAHKQYGDSSVVAVPGVVLRSSATVPPAR
jgi:sigma-E factor negative regulatory protein RseA